MLTQVDDVDVHTLHRQGWTNSAIAWHLGHDRKIIRAYLTGGRVAGQRTRAVPDPFEPYAASCAQRLKDDSHVWAAALVSCRQWLPGGAPSSPGGPRHVTDKRGRVPASRASPGRTSRSRPRPMSRS